jgi:hypothetical protein
MKNLPFNPVIIPLGVFAVNFALLFRSNELGFSGPLSNCNF